MVPAVSRIYAPIPRFYGETIRQLQYTLVISIQLSMVVTFFAIV